MAHLALIQLGGGSGVIGGDKPFGSPPFGEQTEETGNVMHDLVGVVVGEVGRFRRSVLLASGLGIPPITLDPN
jgi:hypothetical protein